MTVVRKGQTESLGGQFGKVWQRQPTARELAGLMEDGSLRAEETPEFLPDLYKMPQPIAAAEEVNRHYQVILAHADAEEPPQQRGGRGKPKHSAGRNLLNRLKKYEDGVLAFALEDLSRAENSGQVLIGILSIHTGRDIHPTTIDYFPLLRIDFLQV